jgi:phospholipid/cholesterol/gamma-HCH transport system ATP-binding protein
VNQGETLAVLGRSGTGKSVLLRLIIGLDTPDSGSVCIHGRDIAGLALDRMGEIRKKMGFLFLQAALYDSLTVQENVAFGLRKMDIAEKLALHNAADRACKAPEVA